MQTATLTSSLAPRSPSMAALASLESITGFERSIMRRLDTAPATELVRIGEIAHRLGGTAWRIECKCHAKLLDREFAKRGRGNKDTEGIGVKAAARAVALATNRHPSTILKDAQIYRELLQNGRSDATGLQEKTFYVIALSAHNPQKALRRMAKMKHKRPDFSTRDARSLVEDINAGRTPPCELANGDEMLRHLDGVSRTIKQNFIAHSPKEDLITRYYSDWRDDIDWERERLKHDKKELKKSIVAAYKQRGAYTDEAIAKELDRSMEEVRAAVQELIAEGVFTEYVREGGETEKQKGNSRRKLLRLKGEPLGNFYQGARPSSNYVPPADHDDDDEDDEL